MEFYNINGFPNYRLARESERDFHIESNKKGEWKKIGAKKRKGDKHIALCFVGDNVKRRTYLHVLIAEMFVPNPEGKTVVHHIDFDPTNNDPANLMWVTVGEHSKIHNTGENHPKGTGKPPRPVESISHDGRVVRYESMHDAERQTGIRQANIWACCQGKLKTAGGRKWCYAD